MEKNRRPMSILDEGSVVGARPVWSQGDDNTMQYMVLIYESEQERADAPAAESEKIDEAYMEYTRQMAAAGVLRGGEALKPISTATTVRVRSGKVTTFDGPFAETKEQLAGFYLIEVATLDEAIKWASKCPTAPTGSIEVRPVLPMPPE